MRWCESQGMRWLEADLPDAKAVFTTRLGGVSATPYDSLNLSFDTGDQAARVRANRLQIALALGRRPRGVAIGHQVHGARLRLHRWAPNPPAFASPVVPLHEVDGHVLVVPGISACVLVADCLPIALAGPRGVAILHCGWRGLAAGIVTHGVTAVKATHAAIGPGIGREHYEVGEEVLAPFAELGEEVADGRHLDLVAVARRLLEQAGVEQIESADLCTMSDPELFYSHRRDGSQAGRQAGIVWVER